MLRLLPVEYMNTNTLTYTNLSYQFKVGGENGENQVSFGIDEHGISIECTCGKSKRNTPCWHAQYILAGKTSRVSGSDVGHQKELIRKTENTREGRRLVEKARRKFESETHCRRCHSDRIVKIKYSPTARLFTLFKDVTHHTYFCKKCKWTW
jgi:hypothetical protein